jgi:NAD(P)H-hydrate epimerase
VRQIGSPAELLDGCASNVHWLEPGEFRNLPLVRKRDAHKGDFGHALIVAGSVGKSGAAALAGRGALRAGAGLATIAAPLDILGVITSGMPELMTAPLSSTEAGTIGLSNLDYGRFDAIARGKTVLAIGPGLSTHPETQQFIRTVVMRTALPTVLDADGLNAFSAKPHQLSSRISEFLAITPHPGEMGRLTGMSSAEVQMRRLQTAVESAARWKCHVVLKGFHTILATPDGRAFVNTTGNPGMAKGGSGDVLTGMLAGLTAAFRTAHWERVLGLGVYLHGCAADIAAQDTGEAPLLASEIVNAIPAALRQLLADQDHAGR